MRITTTTRTSSSRSVPAWRREQLVRAGFSFGLATRLAFDARYDLHALVALVDAGCPPELAVRILAPLDDEAAA